VTLKGQKPKSPKYPEKLKALGDHIRKRRLDLGLLQRETAERMGVDETTICNWESNRTSPQIHQVPEVIRFLGYNPLQVPETLSDTLRLARKVQGLTQKEMARRLGIDPTTLARWERGKSRPSRKLLRMTKVGELFRRRSGLRCFF
jgi:transcriptional regulator with XRE-family HTH domain